MASAAATERTLTRTVHRTLLGLIVLGCLVLLVLWRTDNPRINQLRMSLIDTFAPSMGWVSQPMDFAWNLARDYRNFLDVYEQNKVLRRTIQAERGWKEVARLLEEENAQLRRLNNVRLAQRMQVVTGEVFADSGGSFAHTALVNVGREDEIQDGAAAMDGAGLVGRVVGVGQRSSRLLLLTDFASRVPILIKPTGQRAILAGDTTGAPKLEFPDGSDPIRPNALVETSGEGGVFPPDLPVGRVVATETGALRVHLHANYARLEFVRLLRYQPDTEIDEPGDLIRPDGRSTPDEDALAGSSEGGDG
ncbi:MAG: rod shape-determining protein MreC [Pseudomonadota bacterium]